MLFITEEEEKKQNKKTGGGGGFLQLSPQALPWSMHMAELIHKKDTYLSMYTGLKFSRLS